MMHGNTYREPFISCLKIFESSLIKDKALLELNVTKSPGHIFLTLVDQWNTDVKIKVFVLFFCFFFERLLTNKTNYLGSDPFAQLELLYEIQNILGWN